MPKPWHPDPTQTLAATPAPAPDMSSEAVLAAAPKTEPVNERSATADAAPKKKRVVARKPLPDDPRQNYAWSRWRIRSAELRLVAQRRPVQPRRNVRAVLNLLRQTNPPRAMTAAHSRMMTTPINSPWSSLRIIVIFRSLGVGTCPAFNALRHDMNSMVGMAESTPSAMNTEAWP